jgi:hypothetical protein
MKYIFLTILTTFSFAASATTYYVALNGSNLNTGKAENPFRTISYGIARMKAGDILYVRTGVYAEKFNISGINGSESSQIVIQAYPGEAPVIDGTSINITTGGALININSSYVILDGFEVRSSSASGITTSASSKNITIRSCKVHDCQEGGIGLSSNYSVVEYCNVYNVSLKNAGGGTSSWSAALSARRFPEYCILRHNVIHDSWGEGLSTFEATHTTIEDNIVYDSYSVHLYISDATDCLVQRNLVYRTKAMGVGRMEGIVLADERHSPASARNTVINNIVYGCQPNFRSGNATPLVDCLIANNTFADALGVTNDFNVQIGSTTHVRSRFINNIIVQENSLPCIFATSGTGLVFKNNLYNKAYDTDATGTGDITGDPKFTQTGSAGPGILTDKYFELQALSPAINKGSVLSEVLDDYSGNSRDKQTDIGALEYFSVDPAILATDLKISSLNGSTSLYVGANLQLIAEILPSTVSNKNVSWSVTNVTGQAIINSSGIISAIKEGAVTVHAATQDGSGISDTLAITISPGTAYVNKMLIYPNPAAHYFNICLQQEAPLPMLVIIYNLSGSIIQQITINSTTKLIEISKSLVNGIYLVQLLSESVTYGTQKLVINR